MPACRAASVVGGEVAVHVDARGEHKRQAGVAWPRAPAAAGSTSSSSGTSSSQKSMPAVAHAGEQREMRGGERPGVGHGDDADRRGPGCGHPFTAPPVRPPTRLALGQQEQNGCGQRDQRAARHQQAPLDLVLADEALQRDGDGADVLAGQHQREQVFVP